ncbi:hypothetical protein [Nannocystis sp. SCPEA4]|uniref:hypothetical protein n=1 Tax=Nannocystis sp. SCPEA4 TaxID=2996787 RepID=UPI00226F57FB|nr:hypothetical protein [Nannocystis sp. SCPEA4]MCY1058403.1 hypothetical protein [Nannocystis sp. SCPEA4]
MELPEVTASGEHVSVAADPGHEMCGGTLAHMDAFVKRLSARLGAPPPMGDQKLVYYWLDEEDFQRRSDCVGFAACSRGREIFATTVPLNHELVHGVALHFGASKPFFAEGLAVSHEGLGGSYYTGVEFSDQDTQSMLLLNGQDLRATSGGYERAGAFASYLMSTYGTDPFLRIYRDVRYKSGLGTIEDAFLSALDTPLETVISEFDEGFLCTKTAYDFKIMECDAPLVEWDGAEYLIDRELSCDEPDVIGPFDGEIVTHQTIDIEKEGLYELRMDGDERPSVDMWTDFDINLGLVVRGVSLTGCGPCESAARLATRKGDKPRSTRLSPGRYSLRLHGNATGSNSLRFWLKRIAD